MIALGLSSGTAHLDVALRSVRAPSDADLLATLVEPTPGTGPLRLPAPVTAAPRRLAIVLGVGFPLSLRHHTGAPTGGATDRRSRSEEH